MSDVTVSIDALELGRAADQDGHRRSPGATQSSDRLEHLRSSEVAPSNITNDTHENGAGVSKADQHEVDDGSNDSWSKREQIVSEIRPDDVD